MRKNYTAPRARLLAFDDQGQTRPRDDDQDMTSSANYGVAVSSMAQPNPLR